MLQGAGDRTRFRRITEAVEHDRVASLRQVLVDAEEGFEALLLGKSVYCFGMPFYAGWGLTQDSKPCERRNVQVSLAQLVAAALICYPRYLDPVTRLPCGPEVMVDRMANGSTPPMTWLIRLRAVQGKLRRFITLSAGYLHG